MSDHRNAAKTHKVVITLGKSPGSEKQNVLCPDKSG
jgi:hypothetical protein